MPYHVKFSICFDLRFGCFPKWLSVDSIIFNFSPKKCQVVQRKIASRLITLWQIYSLAGLEILTVMNQETLVDPQAQLQLSLAILAPKLPLSQKILLHKQAYFDNILHLFQDKDCYLHMFTKIWSVSTVTIALGT